LSIVLQSGLKGECKLERVEYMHTAKAVGSGSIEVLATPTLAAMFEKAACEAIEHLLEEGITTVGTYLEIKHTAATPQDMAVHGTAELMEVDGRLLVFHLSASDEAFTIE
jgi:fluoroacetyl-CoA thioesterase